MISTQISLSFMQEHLWNATLQLRGLNPDEQSFALQNTISPKSICKFELLIQRRAKIGPQGFTIFRQLSKQLKSGDTLARSLYSCRVREVLIRSAVDFLQQTLDPKPGYIRSLWMAIKLFRNLHILDWQSYSTQRLIELYSAATEFELRVEYLTFIRLVQVLSNKVSIQAGLSTYCVEFL